MQIHYAVGVKQKINRTHKDRKRISRCLLLPLKPRWIEHIRSEKPRQCHEPTADSNKNVGYCATFIIPICKEYHQQKYNF